MKNPLNDELYLSRRRPRQEDIRGAYFRDQTAIIHALPFRRLKHKTQVFFAPQNDHICTRIEHVLHVATIAKTICKGLNHAGWKLNDELAFAIGMGHDVGHPPFGHEGESFLNKRLGGHNAFVHEVHSYRVLEYLANKGKGLNLTYAVKDGIICHNGEKYEQWIAPTQTPNKLDNIKDRSHYPTTYEGCIMRISDRVAYLGRDIEDAITAGFIKREDIPAPIREKIGDSNRALINAFVLDIIESSKNSDRIGFSDEKFEMLMMLRNFNYKHIYLSDKMNYKAYAGRMLNTLFDYLVVLFDRLGWDYPKYQESVIGLDHAFGKYLAELHDFYTAKGTSTHRIVADYIAGMTDSYALVAIQDITFPKPIFEVG